MTYHVSNATGLYLIHIAIGFFGLSSIDLPPSAEDCRRTHWRRYAQGRCSNTNKEVESA